MERVLVRRVKLGREIFMPDDAAVDKRDAQQHLNEQPQGDVPSLRLSEQLLSVLDAQNRLRHHYGTVHPTLRAHPLAPSVRDVDVVLPERVTNLRKKR